MTELPCSLQVRKCRSHTDCRFSICQQFLKTLCPPSVWKCTELEGGGGVPVSISCCHILFGQDIVGGL